MVHMELNHEHLHRYLKRFWLQSFLNHLITYMCVTPLRMSEISEKKLEHKEKAIFDSPFMIQSHAESMMKIMGAL